MCIAWFSEEEFLQLRLHADDLNDLHDNYADWLANANQIMRTLKKQHIPFRKVPVNVAKWVAWCEERNLRKDGQARSQYAVELARKM